MEGWSRLTNPILHVITPRLTLVVWLVYGPRGWITGRFDPAAIVLPSSGFWILVRGEVVDSYDFVIVIERGYGPVAVKTAMILAFGLVLATALWGTIGSSSGGPTGLPARDVTCPAPPVRVCCFPAVFGWVEFAPFGVESDVLTHRSREGLT